MDNDLAHAIHLAKQLRDAISNPDTAIDDQRRLINLYMADQIIDRLENTSLRHKLESKTPQQYEGLSHALPSLEGDVNYEDVFHSIEGVRTYLSKVYHLIDPDLGLDRFTSHGFDLLKDLTFRQWSGFERIPDQTVVISKKIIMGSYENAFGTYVGYAIPPGTSGIIEECDPTKTDTTYFVQFSVEPTVGAPGNVVAAWTAWDAVEPVP